MFEGLDSIKNTPIEGRHEVMAILDDFTAFQNPKTFYGPAFAPFSLSFQSQNFIRVVRYGRKVKPANDV